MLLRMGTALWMVFGAVAMVLLFCIPQVELMDIVEAEESGYLLKRNEEEDLQSVREHVRVVQQTDEWALLCYKKPTVSYSATGSAPSLPRCYLHKRACSKRFKVFVYSQKEGGTFFNSVHLSLGGRLRNIVTSNVAEACVFFLGVDTFMFGNLKGVLPASHIEGNAVLRVHHPYAAPPFTGWISNGDLLGNETEEKRPLWGLNHLALGFSDWNIDQEKSYENQAMLAVRSSTSNSTYQPWIDMTIPLPKVVAGPRDIARASGRAALIFFSGAVYSFKSPRWMLKRVRSLSSAIRVWLYCYDKTKGKGRKSLGGKYGKMKARCNSETVRSQQDGFLPWFKTKGKGMVPPVNFVDPTAGLYAKEMSTASFCLVIRGWGFHSYRLLEALYFGCIPIVLQPGHKSPQRGDETYLAPGVMHTVLPMSDILNWTKIAIVESEDILWSAEESTAFVNKLEALKASPGKINEMQQLGVRAHDLILGGANHNESMAVMTEQIIKTYKYRAQLFGKLLGDLNE